MTMEAWLGFGEGLRGPKVRLTDCVGARAPISAAR